MYKCYKKKYFILILIYLYLQHPMLKNKIQINAKICVWIIDNDLIVDVHCTVYVNVLDISTRAMNATQSVIYYTCDAMLASVRGGLIQHPIPICGEGRGDRIWNGSKWRWWSICSCRARCNNMVLFYYIIIVLNEDRSAHSSFVCVS